MVVNFFSKNNFDTGLEGSDVNIGLKVSISASIYIEDLIEALNSNEITWDYNEDLNSQYIILNKAPLNNFKILAMDTIENFNIRVVQCPFNLLDNDSIRGETLAKAKEKGIEVQVRSAFLQGLFFMDRNNLPLSLIELKIHLEELDRICFENKISMSHLALGYCLSKDYVDKVVIGVDSLEQLDLNIKAIKTPLPYPLIEEIDKIKVINKSLLNPSNW